MAAAIGPQISFLLQQYRANVFLGRFVGRTARGRFWKAQAEAVVCRQPKKGEAMRGGRAAAALPTLRCTI
jgi:hypothetical protein